MTMTPVAALALAALLTVAPALAQQPAPPEPQPPAQEQPAQPQPAAEQPPAQQRPAQPQPPAAPHQPSQPQSQSPPQHSFDCIGAERLEDDVFTIPFPRGNATLTDAARSLLAAAVEAANAEQPRNLCVLGLTGQEGGAVTTIRLAAQRAGTVARALEQRGIPASRIRAEARSANFSRAARQGVPAARAVSIVVLPAP